MAELVDRHEPTERQLRFREQYQSEIHPLYSGPLHIGVIYAVGLSVIAWCVSRLQGASWEWLLVIPVFFFSNLFEWWIHKYVMHRLVDVWALRAIYDRHTRQHHQYFTDNEMTVNKAREWRIIFFPWRALFTFMGMGAPFALALGAVVNPNAGYILPRDVYRDCLALADQDIPDVVTMAIEEGVVVANLPKLQLDGLTCYLLSLISLRSGALEAVADPGEK